MKLPKIEMIEDLTFSLDWHFAKAPTSLHHIPEEESVFTFWYPVAYHPAENFTISELRNPSINFLNQHKTSRSTDFQALKSRNVWSGYNSSTKASNCFLPLFLSIEWMKLQRRNFRNQFSPSSINGSNSYECVCLYVCMRVPHIGFFSHSINDSARDPTRFPKDIRIIYVECDVRASKVWG